MPTAMIALGGNSISQKGEAGDISYNSLILEKRLMELAIYIETIIYV